MCLDLLSNMFYELSTITHFDKASVLILVLFITASLYILYFHFFKSSKLLLT